MTHISPMLLQKFKKKASEVVNSNMKLELADPMSMDYYRGYRHGLYDSPVYVSNEAIDLLYEVLNYIENDALQNKVSNFLKGE